MWSTHRVFLAHAHLVSVTKYRHPMFTAATSTCWCGSPDGGAVPARQQPQWRLLAAAAAGVLRLAQHYWRAKRLWSGSYLAGSAGGAPLDVLRIYIAQQLRWTLG
jgi:putative transposase